MAEVTLTGKVNNIKKAIQLQGRDGQPYNLVEFTLSVKRDGSKRKALSGGNDFAVDFYRVSLTGNRADNFVQYASTGRMVQVSGALLQEEFYAISSMIRIVPENPLYHILGNSLGQVHNEILYYNENDGCLYMKAHTPVSSTSLKGKSFQFLDDNPNSGYNNPAYGNGGVNGYNPNPGNQFNQQGQQPNNQFLPQNQQQPNNQFAPQGQQPNNQFAPQGNANFNQGQSNPGYQANPNPGNMSNGQFNPPTQQGQGNGQFNPPQNNAQQGGNQQFNGYPAQGQQQNSNQEFQQQQQNPQQSPNYEGFGGQTGVPEGVNPGNQGGFSLDAGQQNGQEFQPNDQQAQGFQPSNQQQAQGFQQGNEQGQGFEPNNQQQGQQEVPQDGPAQSEQSSKPETNIQAPPAEDTQNQDTKNSSETNVNKGF